MFHAGKSCVLLHKSTIPHDRKIRWNTKAGRQPLQAIRYQSPNCSCSEQLDQGNEMEQPSTRSMALAKSASGRPQYDTAQSSRTQIFNARNEPGEPSRSVDSWFVGCWLPQLGIRNSWTRYTRKPNPNSNRNIQTRTTAPTNDKSKQM